MPSLQTFSDIHAAVTGAVANVRDEIDRIEGILPVATPDDLDHFALDLRVLAGVLNGAAIRKRQADTTTAPVWWQ